MQKVAILGTVGIPANYGGFETLAEQLVACKHRPDIQYLVYCSSAAYKGKVKHYKGAELCYLPLHANGWQSILYDTLSLIEASFRCQKILLLGVGGCFIMPLLRLIRPRVKFIVNLDGLDYRRDKWNPFAAMVIKFGYWVATRFAHTCISDNMAIQEIIYQDFYRDSVLIEYGGDFQVEINVRELEPYMLAPKSYYFKVARIEPENNIELVLRAFSRMPDKKLVLVGTWRRNEYAIKLRQIYEQYPNITLLDPVYDYGVLSNLRYFAIAYIHGHSVGGTNPTLVEAMHLGVPIIAYDVIYNRSTTQGKCLYFNDSASLKRVVCETSREELQKVAENMVKISRQRYVWSLICEKYEELYG